MISAVVGDELRGDCDRFGCVNLEVGTRAKKLLVAQSIRLNVTSILVAQALETIWAIVTTISTFTPSLALSGAGMHGVCSADGICLPDVDFCATTTILACASIDIGFAWLPILHVGLTIDEFQIMWALCITISKAILCTCIAVLALATISIHLHKV